MAEAASQMPQGPHSKALEFVGPLRGDVTLIFQEGGDAPEVASSAEDEGTGDWSGLTQGICSGFRPETASYQPMQSLSGATARPVKASLSLDYASTSATLEDDAEDLEGPASAFAEDSSTDGEVAEPYGPRLGSNAASPPCRERRRSQSEIPNEWSTAREPAERCRRSSTSAFRYHPDKDPYDPRMAEYIRPASADEVVDCEVELLQRQAASLASVLEARRATEPESPALRRYREVLHESRQRIRSLSSSDVLGDFALSDELSDDGLDTAEGGLPSKSAPAISSRGSVARLNTDATFVSEGEPGMQGHVCGGAVSMLCLFNGRSFDKFCVQAGRSLASAIMF